MAFDYRELHEQLSALYAKPFLSPESLPKYDDESCRRDAERNIRYFVDPFVLNYHLRCLEVGCGRGALTGLLAARGAEALGLDTIDFSEDWHQWETKYNTARFEHVDFHRAQLKQESFDLIVSIGTWEHIYNPVEALKKAFHLLRPGGLFIGHIGMYFSRRGSHMYRLIKYPYPTLFFNEHELEDIVREETPFVNTMTCSHYRDFCERIGYRTLLWQEVEEAPETELFRLHPKTFQKVPPEDLGVPLLNVVLWKPRRNELNAYRGMPRNLRGPVADWRTDLPRILPYQISPRYGVAAHLIRDRRSVLDLGCGRGVGTCYLAQFGPRAVGVGPDRAAIIAARRKAPATVSYICGQMLPSLAELRQAFDVIVLDEAAFSNASFTYHRRVAELLVRSLKAGGAVVIESAAFQLSQHLLRQGLRTAYDGAAFRRFNAYAPFGRGLHILEKIA